MPTKTLSKYFKGVAAKRLSPVEIDANASHQHEFNGVADLKRILGNKKNRFRARVVYLGKDEDDFNSAECKLTWYDAREAHETRSEFRLYFPSLPIFEAAKVGDLLVIGKRPDNSVLLIVVQQGTTYENQIRWLFGLHDDLFQFAVNDFSAGTDRVLDLAERFILDELGIEVETADENWLDRIIERFGEKFPETKHFSSFARDTLPDISSTEEPDSALIAWMEREEMLFRTLEKHIVSIQLEKKFSTVEEFISYSLSVLNRRKSRVGHALENHLEYIFNQNKITFTRNAVTENNAKPDFVFPDIDHYFDSSFPASKLTMLGVKSTCKDRWRQILSEAARIKKKHLFTLEPSISLNQTEEMRANNLKLVLPKSLHTTYMDSQQEMLMTLSDFISLVKSRQKEKQKKSQLGLN